MSETDCLPETSSQGRLIDVDDENSAKINSSTNENDQIQPITESSGTIQSTSLQSIDQSTIIQPIRSQDSIIEAINTRRCLPCWNYGSDSNQQPQQEEEIEGLPRSSYTNPGSESQQQQPTQNLGPILNKFILELFERWIISFIRRYYQSPYFIFAVGLLIILLTTIFLILVFTGNLEGLIKYSRFLICILVRQFDPTTNIGFCSSNNNDDDNGGGDKDG
ncbi:hypothetical protein KGF54_002506 [Candida jiufengensis]|uniref:uncharacterized protein n=1 Tax=Candida jiufengensis TaxID=497108 RepID=UPI002224851D|nr:uncharacterized protein KGF54_002506 [Candida jiufengensis]KAI5953135.1 hypothetical protein KGF54_002506 [Candida jiufengensis]